MRKAQPDGTSAFLRPLPGAARLYPETDALPIQIGNDFLARTGKNLPELRETRLARQTSELGVSQTVISSLEKKGLFPLFQKLSKFQKVKPELKAQILLSYDKELLRRDSHANPQLIKEGHFLEIFDSLDKGSISKDSVFNILAEVALGRKPDFSKYRLEKIDLEDEVKGLLREKPGLSFSAYMGLLMAKYKGRVPGQDIAKALKKVLG